MAWQAIAAAGISALGGLLGTMQNNRMSTDQMRLQHRMNSELMREQYRQNVNMWNMENAYNSPYAQMQRYQEAGLNPNLIYNQQNTGGSIHPVDPIPTQVPKQSSAIPAVADALGEGLVAYQNMKGFETDQKIKEEQLRGIRIANDYKEIMSGIKKFDLDNLPEVFQWKRNAEERAAGAYNMKEEDFKHGKTLWDYQDQIVKNKSKISDYEANDGLWMRSTIDYYKGKREIQGLYNDIASGKLTKAKTSEAYARISKIQHSMHMDELRIQLASSGMLLKVAEFNRSVKNDNEKLKQQKFENWLKANKDIADALKDMYGSVPGISTVLKELEVVTNSDLYKGSMYDPNVSFNDIMNQRYE